MTSQNFKAMPKDRSRKSEQHWLNYSGLSQRGEASGEGRSECVTAPKGNIVSKEK